MTQDNYCIGCKLRLHNRIDKPGFCEAGYTQTPLSLDATVNVIRNGGHTCSKNPLKGRALREIVAVEKEAGILDASTVVSYCR